ncbi:MAG: hypothetical protein WBA17_10225 [Saprospiraceae bacterium]
MAEFISPFSTILRTTATGYGQVLVKQYGEFNLDRVIELAEEYL